MSIDWKAGARHYRTLYHEAVDRGCNQRDVWKAWAHKAERERDEAQARAEAAEGRVGEIASLLADIRESLEISADVSIRAESIRAPEDLEVWALCQPYGYGAVMDSAARQWFSLSIADGGGSGAFTVGPCYGTVMSLLERIDAALSAAPSVAPGVPDRAAGIVAAAEAFLVAHDRAVETFRAVANAQGSDANAHLAAVEQTAALAALRAAVAGNQQGAQTGDQTETTRNTSETVQGA